MALPPSPISSSPTQAPSEYLYRLWRSRSCTDMYVLYRPLSFLNFPTVADIMWWVFYCLLTYSSDALNLPCVFTAATRLCLHRRYALVSTCVRSHDCLPFLRTPLALHFIVCLQPLPFTRPSALVSRLNTCGDDFLVSRHPMHDNTQPMCVLFSTSGPNGRAQVVEHSTSIQALMARNGSEVEIRPIFRHLCVSLFNTEWIRHSMSNRQGC